MSLEKPFHLFEALFSTPQYYTDADITVAWSGNLYRPTPVSVGGLGKSTTSFSETLTIDTHNVDRVLAAIVLNEDIQGKEFRLYRSEWTAPGSFSNPVLLFKGQFDSFNIDEGYNSADAQLAVKNDFVRWEMAVPRATFAGCCQWKFKSTTPGCQYTGVASMCNKTWERCAELVNTHRFRGFRWLPMLEDKEIWWGRGGNPATGGGLQGFSNMSFPWK